LKALTISSDMTPIGQLMPGCIAEATVQSVSDDGLRLSLGPHKASISRSFLSRKNWMDASLADTYQVAQNLRVKVLYVHRGEKRVGVSNRKDLLSSTNFLKPSSMSVNVGDIVEDSAVAWFNAKSGAIITLPSGSVGFVPPGCLVDEKVQKVKGG
jgi:ribosomal protein S1